MAKKNDYQVTLVTGDVVNVKAEDVSNDAFGYTFTNRQTHESLVSKIPEVTFDIVAAYARHIVIRVERQDSVGSDE